MLSNLNINRDLILFGLRVIERNRNQASERTLDGDGEPAKQKQKRQRSRAKTPQC